MRGLAASLLWLPLLAQESVNLYSVEKELALRRHVAAEIRRQSKPLENADVAEYASRIGTRLVSHLAESPRFPYSFGVIIDAGMTEPIALPGNHILIPAGFFLAGQDESEFAVMLAHTIGHSILRQQTRATRPVETANPAASRSHTGAAGLARMQTLARQPKCH